MTILDRAQQRRLTNLEDQIEFLSSEVVDLIGSVSRLTDVVEQLVDYQIKDKGIGIGT